MQKFIRHTSEHFYHLEDKREFYDMPCPLEGKELEVAVDLQKKAWQLNAYLSECYALERQGAKTDGVPKPAWLNAEFDQDFHDDVQRSAQASAALSSKKSPGRPKKSESSTSTSQKVS